ncbi:hypothetical protein SCHPADRAFT_492467 [Schizopora paradoxa]|uniref:DUF6533 domain-containing protein n=1 Tax=Schizopora paradoxa TaxID=27342 RepID=A0A0H2RNJ2_9AGAM|nr:hypothetical protein SCHPADRAFT_492467 [Schizopora paradoxa]
MLNMAAYNNHAYNITHIFPIPLYSPSPIMRSITMSGTTGTTAEEAAALARTLQIFQYSSVAFIALLSYEYLIEFDDEIRYLWNRRLSLGGVLLLLCRYLPFSSSIFLYLYVMTTNFDPSHCRAVSIASTVIVIVEFMVAIMVLLIRSYVVWERSKRMTIVMIIWACIVIAGLCYPVAMYDENIFSAEIHTTHGCIVMDRQGNRVGIGIIFLLASETFSLGILLAKAISHRRFMKNMHSEVSKDCILTVMARLGIGYYLCTIAISIMNFVLLEQGPPSLKNFLRPFQAVFQNILCARLLFHIRSLGDEPLGASSYEGKVSTLITVRSEHIISSVNFQ